LREVKEWIIALESDDTWVARYDRDLENFGASQQREFEQKVAEFREESFSAPLTEALLAYMENPTPESEEAYFLLKKASREHSWGPGRSFASDFEAAVEHEKRYDRTFETDESPHLQDVRSESVTDIYIQQISFYEQLIDTIQGQPESERNTQIIEGLQSKLMVLNLDLFQFIEFLKHPEIEDDPEKPRRVEHYVTKQFRLKHADRGVMSHNVDLKKTHLMETDAPGPKDPFALALPLATEVSLSDTIEDTLCTQTFRPLTPEERDRCREVQAR